MIKELAQDIKNYNFLEKLKIDYYIDAVDEGRWKVGKVVAFKSVGHRHTITVRFDGHTPRWNQDYDLPSSHKLAPFRRFSLPYTGPWTSGRQIFRDAPNLNFQEPKRELSRINIIEKMKPEFINQVYRGELFILVDNILTRKTGQTKEEFANTKSFLITYINAAIQIMKFALQKIPQISSQNITDPNVIYVSTTYALVHSLTEFLFNLNSMINPAENRVKFFTLHDNLMPANELRRELKQIMIDNEVVQMCKNIMQYQNPPHRGFPWNIKKEALILLSNFQEKGLQFPKISDAREIPDLMDYLHYLANKSAFSFTVIGQKHMQLVITLVISGKFEGKLKGINQLKKIIEDIKKNPKMLRQKIIQNNLLQVLTDNASFNGQIFKRSVPVFEYAQKSDLLTPQILRRIINLHKDKHQLELKSYYTTLIQFGRFLDEKKVLSFFDQIKQFPIQQHWINLIKEFTLVVSNQHPVYKARYMDQASGLGVVCFWDVIENKKDTISEQLMDKIILAFSQMLVNPFYKKQFNKYIVECIYGIKKKKNMDAYFKIIHSSVKKNKDFASLIQKIDSQMNIVDTVVNSVISQENLSMKAVQNMFQFLEEVNHYAKNKMTVLHIKTLWNLTACRNSLLKFMRKYRTYRGKEEKSTDKILLKQLGHQEIKEIVQNIFLNIQLMGGYIDVSEQTFQTVDELLVCYNHQMKLIDYNYKHTIRCERPEEIFGLNFYMNIIVNSQKQEIADKALKRMIQYFIRPVSKTFKQSSQKLNAWTICVKYLSKLKEKKYRAYNFFFEEVQGRTISLTILETMLVNLLVMNKATKQKKTISLPRNTSLWRLRQVIDEIFGLNKTNFQMFYTARNNCFDMERQEDFSLAYVEIPKDPSVPSVVITPTKQPHPHFVSIEQFKKIFANTYAEGLYQLIPAQNLQSQQMILKLLLSVPAIKNLQKKISKLEPSIPWEQMFDIESKIKLSYQLSIAEKVKNPQWAINFTKRKGVEHLQKIFLRRNKSPTFNSFDYKVLTDLMGLFNQMLKFYKHTSQTLPFTEQFILQIIRLPKSTKNLENLDYFYSSFGILKEITNYKHMNLKTIMENTIMTQLLQILLFSDFKTPAADRLPQILISVCEKGNCLDNLQVHLEGFLVFNWLKKNRNSCRIFFNLLVMVFKKKILKKKSLFEKARQFITQMREKNEIFEEDETNKDQLIYGWLKLIQCLTSLYKEDKAIKVFHEPQQNFALYLINEGLFNKMHRIRTSQSRQIVYQILSNMKCEDQVFNLIGDNTLPMMKKGSWRKQFQWFVRSFKKRKPESYVGIKNLAATCYINSLLQQLFHIPQFSNPLLGVNAKQIDDPENIAYEIQKIFAHLKHSDNDVYTTESLCRTFILDGQPIDPRIQTDVDEFFHSLMDKLERNFIKIEKKDIIDNIFRGEYSNLIIGQECSHKSERIEHFLSMRLQILNKKSLQQALQEFIKGEILEGDNAYFCQKCDKKVKALKRVCVKNLPDILILTLKRFQFDFDKMEKFKLNTYCQFPEELDMFPYTRQALENQEKVSNKNHQYRLKGIIIHYGISEAGHYTSYIRTADNQWQYFDDDRISPFNFKDLGKECFGGVEQNFYGENSEKMKNAYLLIYERVNIAPPMIIPIDASIKEEVEEENERNQEVKILFEDGLRMFMDKNSIKMGKNYLTYVHLVFLRSERRSKNLVQTYNRCVALFEGNKNLMDWYLDQFSENFIREMMIYAYFETSYFVASLAIYCVERTVNVDFIKRCMKCLEVKNMVPLTKVFQAAVQASPHYMKSLAQFSFQQKVFRIIKQQKAPNAGSSSKIANVRSQFGECDSKFIERKDYRDPIEYIQAIENFKVTMNFEQMEFLILRAKKLGVQHSLAKVIVTKYKDQEGLNALVQHIISRKLIKEEPKLDQQHSFCFILILIYHLAAVKDQFSIKRSRILSEIYLQAIYLSIQGYKAMRYLIQGLFNICFTNQVFWTEFLNVLASVKESKKIIKLIRDWIKEGQRVFLNVRNEKMGYWRKPDRKYYVSRACLDRIEMDQKIKPERYLSLFNALLEKHRIEYANVWNCDKKVGETIIIDDYEGTQGQITRKAGLLLEIEGGKLVSEDDVMVIRQY